MEQSFGLVFHLKKPKNFKKGELPVYMRITVDGLCCEISTRQKSDPGLWNKDAGRLTGKSEKANAVNAYLDTLQLKVFEAKRKLIEIDKPVTPTAIKNLLLGKGMGEPKRMLMEIFQKHNDQIRELINREYAAGTIERYETSYKHTRSFLETRYKVSDIDICSLNNEFIMEYEFWLKTVRKCGQNSTVKYLSNFRKIINRCIRLGWLPRDPFLGFQMKKTEVERIALTLAELETISHKKFPTERLSLVKDIFLFSCFSGLAYADVKNLKRSDITEGEDGQQWLHSRRQKTNITARIPLLAAAAKIIDKYKSHPQVILDNRVLPVLSNQKMNAYLKEIADCCEISKNLTFHIARHTFATTVTLSSGVPIETVSKMLGHRNLKTTQHYARVLDFKIGQDMKVVKDKFSKMFLSIDQ
jgi:site-specific recombinase XerD